MSHQNKNFCKFQSFLCMPLSKYRFVICRHVTAMVNVVPMHTLIHVSNLVSSAIVIWVFMNNPASPCSSQQQAVTCTPLIGNFYSTTQLPSYLKLQQFGLLLHTCQHCCQYTITAYSRTAVKSWQRHWDWLGTSCINLLNNEQNPLWVNADVHTAYL